MDYNEVLQRARERIGPKCKVCPECNGLGCGNTMPGPGSKAPGNGSERQLARVAALEPEHGHDRAEHARGHVGSRCSGGRFPCP